MGKAVGNFTAEEWYPGGEQGTTDNITSTAYEDQTPAVDAINKYNEFKKGEQLFERRFTPDKAPFKGLGPAYVRDNCLVCHPGYGHGMRKEVYNADDHGNGYLLVIYDKTTGAYISQVTGMPQTRAQAPFKAPIDESQISITWSPVTSMPSGLEMKFPKDGEKFELIYPTVTIPQSAFRTDPQPVEGSYEVRLESTIGIYGTGLIDAISDDDLIAQYKTAAKAGAELNPLMWDAAKNDMAASAWYAGYPSEATDKTPHIKRYTYALTRGSLQDGPGANAIWNITNVTRSDRHYFYTTPAWAKAMSKDAEVIKAIKDDVAKYGNESSLYAYYADGTDEGIAAKVLELLSLTANNKETHDKFYAAFGEKGNELSDDQYYSFMIWHRGLAVPRARNLQSEQVQRGKELFTQMGCVHCHRPSWTTGQDNYWADNITKSKGELPRYQNQKIWPYSDFVQHRLHMLNDIKGGWCRTTPLWGRGLSKQNTGAEDRLHDCRARNEVEAIMWHAYSKESDAYKAAEQFYNLPKADRDAVVAFIRAI